MSVLVYDEKQKEASIGSTHRASSRLVLAERCVMGLSEQGRIGTCVSVESTTMERTDTGESGRTSRRFRELTNLLLESDLVIDNTGSEPRDVLMTERTTLSWIKFSITLSAVAVTIVTDFRLDTSGSPGGSPDSPSPVWLAHFSYGVSILFILLSISTLLVGVSSYIQSIYNYKNHKVSIYSLKVSLGYLGIVGVVLLAINIVFMAAVGV